MKGKKINRGLIVILAFFVVSLLYFLIKRDGIYLQIHDYLDSGIPHYKMLKDNHIFWSFNSLTPYLGGIDRNYFFSELKVSSWLYMVLPCLPAIIVGWYLKIALSVSGFYFLGKEIFFPHGTENGSSTIFLLTGFLCALTPTQPINSFGFVSLPLLLTVLIRLYRKFEFKYIVILFFYPFLSDFVFFGFFICAYLALFFIIDWIYKKKPCLRFISAAAALSAGYIVSEWRLFYTIFFSDTETIREGFVTYYAGLAGLVKDFIWVFVLGQYHSASLHFFPILPLCLIFFVFINFKYIKEKTFKKIFTDPFNAVMLVQVLNTLLYVVNETEIFKAIIAAVIPPLKGFSFARAIWLSPFLWYFAFMLVLCRVSWKPVIKYIVIALSFIVLCLVPSKYNHISENLYMSAVGIVGEERAEKILNKEIDKLTFGEFYSEKLFENIKDKIGYDGEWAIAYGMHPGVLEYNHISTLDGYVSFYSMEYKKAFRKMIAPELETDETNRKSFDEWGGRAYVFSNEIGYDAVKKLKQNEAELLIDPAAFKEMGGKYVFSRVRVINYDELGFEELGMFTEQSSPYNIWVYEIK